MLLLPYSFGFVLQDINEFQREKQGRLNQVPVDVSLRLHQVQYHSDQQLPEDLTGALVFGQEQLDRLKARMKVRKKHRM